MCRFTANPRSSGIRGVANKKSLWHGVTSCSCPVSARAQQHGARARNRIEANTTEHFFDRERLDVYRLAIEYRLSIEHVVRAMDALRSSEGLIAMLAISGCERPNPFRSTLPRATHPPWGHTHVLIR